MISSFSQRPLRYFLFLALPFFIASLVVGVTAPQELLGGGSEFALDTLAVLAFMLPFMACAYFLLLGLLVGEQDRYGFIFLSWRLIHAENATEAARLQRKR